MFLQNSYLVNNQEILYDEVSDDQLVLDGKHIWLQPCYLSQGDERSVEVLIIVVQVGDQGLPYQR